MNGEYWNLGRHILDACLVDGIVIVIFDYMSYPREKQARNMVAYDLQKRELWTAEHPTNEVADTYVNFLSFAPLRACNFRSFDCTINPQTGRIIETNFTK